MRGDGADALYRFAVVPRFLTPGAWSERLARSGGAEVDSAGRVHLRDDWTAIDDVAALVDELSGRDAVLPPTHLGVLEIPTRLRKAWWVEAERAGAVSGATFEKVFADIVEFLRFKRVPLPDRVSLEVTVSAPDASSASGAGLGVGGRQPLGLVNLGDEPSHVVLLDLPPRTLAARLAAAADELAPTELVARYLRRFPQEPFLRVRLAPGEGLWLSPRGVVHDRYTRGKRDLDVFLSIGGAA